MNVPANPNQESLKCFTLWLLALSLTVLGAKLWMVQLYGSPMWLWDQWYEANQFLKPWLEGRATWHDYIAPYCEHRILFTRLLDIGIIGLNGRLEPLLQMTVDAFIHTTYICGLAFWLWDFLGRRNGGIICCLLMPFFALPYAGENTTWAFNSQAYMLAIFTLPSLVWLGFGQLNSWRWWAGLVMAVLGLFTMASGLLTPMAIAGLAIFRMLKRRRVDKTNLATLAAGLAVAALGGYLFTPFAGDEPLRAHGFGQFAAAMIRDMSWPFFHAPEMAVFIALPLVLLAVVYFLPSFKESRAAELLLVLGLWSVLQTVALAYGRGNFGEEVPASRYMDKLNVFVIASLFATVLLARFWLSGAMAKKIALFPTLIFAAVIVFGLVRISEIVVDQLLVQDRLMNLVAEERVQKFMADGNEKDFFEAPTVRPDPKVIEGVLHDPTLQAVMPAANLAPAPTPVTGRLSGVSDALWRHAVLMLYTGLGLALGLLIVALVRSPQGIVWENIPGLIILVALMGVIGCVWGLSPIHRESVERQMDNQLAVGFKMQNKLDRAAYFEQREKELEGK